MNDTNERSVASPGSTGRCLLVLRALLAIGCTSPSVNSPTSPTPYSQYPKLSAHCRTCKQCASPMSESGEEQSLCDEGFRLLQDDLRPGK